MKNLNKTKINLSKLINLSSIDSILKDDPELKAKIHRASDRGKSSADFNNSDINKLKSTNTKIDFDLYRGVYPAEISKYNLKNIKVGSSFNFDGYGGEITSFSSRVNTAIMFAAGQETSRSKIILKSTKSDNVCPYVDLLDYCLQHPVIEMFEKTNNPENDLIWAKSHYSTKKGREFTLSEQEYFVWNRSKFTVTKIYEKSFSKFPSAGKLLIIEGYID